MVLRSTTSKAFQCLFIIGKKGSGKYLCKDVSRNYLLNFFAHVTLKAHIKYLHKNIFLILKELCETYNTCELSALSLTLLTYLCRDFPWPLTNGVASKQHEMLHE